MQQTKYEDLEEPSGRSQILGRLLLENTFNLHSIFAVVAFLHYLSRTAAQLKNMPSNVCLTKSILAAFLSILFTTATNAAIEM